MNEVLTSAEMGEADRRAIAAGVPELTLMENAGRAVAATALPVEPGSPVLVLCGPGNNGGDGFVAARHLAAAGRHVEVALLGQRERLSGAAVAMADRWHGPLVPVQQAEFEAAGVIVDALFGAGLSRPIEGSAAEAVDRMNMKGAPVVAVDVPSGVNGTTGGVNGPTVRATNTVTFFRLKPAHLLLPGRELCGDVHLADIGIPDEALPPGVRCYANAPQLWLERYPVLSLSGHKYSRGHAIVVSGGPTRTGAARLAAVAALRAGAGLVTVASPAAALAANAAHLTAVMLVEAEGPAGLRDTLQDERLNAVLLGPGLGLGADTAAMVLAALSAERAVVLDADALTVFQDDPMRLFDRIAGSAGPVVLTPHEGEFKRLFACPEASSKLERARAAARLSGATIVLKGADTVIASPDGQAAINSNAPPWLATAGSGDTLAGIITGLLAQGMPAFEAAAASAWLHGAAAQALGRGMIAEDLGGGLAKVISELHAS